MSPQTQLDTDLIFTVSGGPRDGELLPIKTRKCVLAMDEPSSANVQRHCALFRGSAGVTFRNYGDEILINGESKATHWLVVGDQIQFPNSMKLEVTQLGWVEPESADESHADGVAAKDSPAHTDAATEPTSEAEPELETKNSIEVADVVQAIPEILAANDTINSNNELEADIVCEAIPTDDSEKLAESENGPEVASQADLTYKTDFSYNTDLSYDTKLTYGVDSSNDADSTHENPTMTEGDVTKVAASFSDDGPASVAEPVSQAEVVNELEASPAAESTEEFGICNEVEHSIHDAADCQWEVPHENNDSEELQVPQRKLNFLESQIDEIREQNSQVQGRFNELDQRLSQLTDQLSTLVTLAGSGPARSSIQPSETLALIRRTAETVDYEKTTPSETKQAATTPQDTNQAFDSIKRVPTPTDPTIPAIGQSRVRQPDASLASEWAKIESSPSSLLESLKFETAGSEPESDCAIESAAENLPMPTLEQPPVHQEPAESDISEEVDENIEAGNRSERKSLLEDFQTDEAGDRDEMEAQSESIFATDEVVTPELPSEPAVETPAPIKSESVADLLARMKSEGQWKGIGDDDDQPQESTAVASVVSPTESPTFAQPVSEPVAEIVEREQPKTTKAAVTEATDVQDYMSQLLSRMRGGNEPVSKPIVAASKQESPATPVASTTAQSVEPMTPEEFLPKQKAAKIESLGAMRELANSTARTAVASSEEDRRKALAYVQLAIAIGSLIMALYYFLFLCKSFGDTHSLVGFICLGLSGFLGYRYYSTINPKNVADKPADQTA